MGPLLVVTRFQVSKKKKKKENFKQSDLNKRFKQSENKASKLPKPLGT